MPFRYDKLTIKAQEAVQRAQEIAAQRGNPQIDAVHLLAGLLAETEGVVRPVLERIGANRAQLDKVVDGELKQFPQSSGGTPPQPAASLMHVFEGAAQQAETMKDEFVSTEHLLLALAKHQGPQAPQAQRHRRGGNSQGPAIGPRQRAGR
jgi:ATP-dependent Clp protease ATP-binding subunit ClpB